MKVPCCHVPDLRHWSLPLLPSILLQRLRCSSLLSWCPHIDAPCSMLLSYPNKCPSLSRSATTCSLLFSGPAPLSWSPLSWQKYLALCSGSAWTPCAFLSYSRRSNSSHGPYVQNTEDSRVGSQSGWNQLGLCQCYGHERWLGTDWFMPSSDSPSSGPLLVNCTNSVEKCFCLRHTVRWTPGRHFRDEPFKRVSPI